MDAVENWGKWKNALAKGVQLGESVGLSEETMDNIALKVGNFLSSNIDPENREQRVIKDLWSAGDEEDRKALSKLMLKMAGHENNNK